MRADANSAAVLLKATSVARGAEVLQVLLADDESLAIKLLARMDPGRAKSLRPVRDFARKEWPLRGSWADVLR